MIKDEIIKKLEEKNYLLEVENEKLKTLNVIQEKVIKNIHVILQRNALLKI